MVKRLMTGRFQSRAAILLALAGLTLSRGQTFDNSNNSSLQGNYFIWELALSGFRNDGSFSQARSLYGSMTFDGQGNYSFNGQLNDTNVGSGGQPYSTNGQYALSSSGMA